MNKDFRSKEKATDIICIIFVISVFICNLFATEDLNSTSQEFVIGKPINATILNGYVFTEEERYINSTPIVLKDETDCYYLGNAKYSVSIGKVFIELDKVSCNSEYKQIKGYVYEDNYSGVNVSTDYSKEHIIAILKPFTKVTIVTSNTL